jgi:predicted PurR-regulated permease PerM
MTDTTKPIDQNFSRNAMDAAIKIGLVALLALWCLQIIAPFAIIFLWAAILAIAFNPLCARLSKLCGGRRGPAAAILTLVAVGLLIGPVGSLGAMFVQDLAQFVTMVQEGERDLPPPRDSVRDWPLIGPAIYDFWSLAATNLRSALQTIEPQIKAAGQLLLTGVANTGLGLLQFLVALIIAGFLMVRPDRANHAAVAVAARMAGTRGERLVRLMENTVRTVTRGVLGTAVIQTLFAGLGMMVAGIPGAGLWTVICLLLAVIQVGPGIVLLGTVIYMFSEASTLAAVLYTAWAVPVTLLDNVLKPILMGRGSDVPVIITFLGVIGGTFAYGLIGVFVGPVVLAVGYALFASWVKGSEGEALQT